MNFLSKNPPRFANFILKWILSREEFTEKSGDLEEVYNYQCDDIGKFKAKLWFWMQVLKAIPVFILNTIYWRSAMLKNYVKIALRNLRKHKGYSFINITGLAIGMACCILLILYINSELSYDNYHTNGDKIYRLCVNGNFGGNEFTFSASNATAAEVLRNEYPEVLNTVRFGWRASSMVSHKNEQFYLNSIMYADGSVFDIFSWPMLNGDPATALVAPNSIVLTEEVAKMIFADENPLGKFIEFNDKENFTITGVMKDIPEYSHFTFRALCSFKTLYTQGETVSPILTDWISHNFWTYILLKENFNYKELEGKLPVMINKYAGEQLKATGGKLKLFLQPLKDIYLKPLGITTGPIFYVYVFAAIALIVLLIACVNFMNLSTARSINRAKEVGIRKVFGAFQRKLVIQFLSEALTLSFFSLLIALILVKIALPNINALIGRELSLNLTWFVPGALALMFITGLLAGSYPAFYLSKFQPVAVLRGKLNSVGSKSNFRRTLVVLQFTISIILIIGTGVIISQLNYMKNKDVGFEKEHVVVVRISDSETRESISRIKTELKNYTGVLHVAASSTIPGWGAPNNAKIPEGFSETEHQIMDEINVDAELVPTLGIEIVAGRNFSKDFPSDENNAILINETAAKKYNWENPIGKTIKAVDPDDFGKWLPKTVIGVVKDFHINSLYREINPLFILNEPDYPLNYNKLDMITIRISPDDMTGTIQFLEKKWQEVAPNSPFNYFFLDEEFAYQFNRIEGSRDVFSYFSFLAIFIACLGLFGIAVFSAEQKTKEIGIRKVLGSTISGIIILLNKELIMLILLAAAIACPVAYFILNTWLQNFPYHTTMNIFVFIGSSLLVIIIGLATISFQAIKAARANPVNAFKYE